MANPFVHTHVSFVTRKGRRRSQSLSIPYTTEDDPIEQSMARKQFLAQLRHERQKQYNKQNGHDEYQQEREDRAHTVVTRVAGGIHPLSTSKQISSITVRSAPLKKQISTTSHKTTVIEDEDHHHHPMGTQISQAPTMISVRKQLVPTGFNSNAHKDEIASVSSDTLHSEDHKTEHGHQSHVIRAPQSKMEILLNGPIGNKTLQNSELDSSKIYKLAHHNSSKTSSHIFQSSSMNLISKSQIFDQDFYLDDPSHTRKNTKKNHGKVNISGREKRYYTNYDRKMAARSSASCMGAVIAMVIGLIALAFGIASLILVLLLRSTVDTKLAEINATSSNGASSSSSSLSSSTNLAAWTEGCSNYTTINDPTRSIRATGYALGCDNTAPFINRTMPVWIRFTGTGGTILPLTTPGMNICGSESTGWYDGTMPSSGEMVNGTACFSWYNSICRFSQSISVANCGSYYTYRLPPAPTCMARYCTI